MCGKELGLGPAAVATLAIPILRTTALEIRARSALDGDSGSLDPQERSCPFFVTP